MTHLDPKALEAAEAAHGKTCGGLLEGRPMANAVLAYLAALPQAEPVGWQVREKSIQWDDCEWTEWQQVPDDFAQRLLRDGGKVDDFRIAEVRQVFALVPKSAQRHRRLSSARRPPPTPEVAMAIKPHVFSADPYTSKCMFCGMGRGRHDAAIQAWHDQQMAMPIMAEEKASELLDWRDLPEVKAAKAGMNALYLEAPESVCRDVSARVAAAFQAIAALSTSPSPPKADGPGEVGVKPINWQQNSQSSIWSGELIFGAYYTLDRERSSWRVYRGQMLREYGPDEVAFVGDLDAAKAAAQADYEALILSALVSPSIKREA